MSIVYTEEGTALPPPGNKADEDRRIADTIRKEQPRLRAFIRRRVGDEQDVEDILQDVFYQLVEAYRLLQPIEEIGAWLFRVARNRIVDRLRKKRPEPFPPGVRHSGSDDEFVRWEELLPSADAGPEVAYARRILLDELATALDELPDEQREVFLAHEVEGRSFKAMAAETGININTLLWRKHAAVAYLRQRLHAIYQEFRGTWGSDR
jgi:RNA polymerase sigma factor (sigma-70 family)